MEVNGNGSDAHTVPTGDQSAEITSNGNLGNGASSSIRRNNSALQAAKRFRREFGSDDDDETMTMNVTGPIYPVTENSFVLPNGTQGEFDVNYYDESLNPTGVVPVVVHADMVSGFGMNILPLTDEQKKGITYLWNCAQIEEEGGILAHDMGVGKTRVGVVLVATLSEQSSRSQGKSKPGLRKCLIIVPKNALSGWEDEFQKWCPRNVSCKVEVLRPMQKDGWDVVKDFKTNSSQVLILSYESFQKFNTGFVEGFKSYRPNSVDLVICDEAHNLKNNTTKRFKNLSSFDAARVWVGITGTPFQNNLEEICNLVKFFRKSVFENTDYKKKYCMPIDNDLRKSKKLTQKSKALLKELRNIIYPVLDVSKNDFAIERHEVTLCIPLHGHPHYYSEEVDGGELWTLQHRMYKELTEILKSSKDMPFFEKLSYLHKTCINPTLLREALNKPEWSGMFQTLIDTYEKILPSEHLNDPYFQKRLPLYSAKILVVAKMAKYLKKNLKEEKMVIVSNSMKLLKMLKKFLEDTLKTNVVVFDGETTDEARERNKKKFEEDPSVQFLLLSLKAGGTALNLTRANHLILMDPDYNPANDRQALARVYRMGQTRPVFIYRLLLTGTIEEIKYILQISKEDTKKCTMTPEPNGPLDVQRPFKEADLLSYDDTAKSLISNLLDKFEIEEHNLDEIEKMDHIFAEGLKQSQKIWQEHEVPDKLLMLKNIWKHVSYAFYIPKIIHDEIQLLFDCTPSTISSSSSN